MKRLIAFPAVLLLALLAWRSPPAAAAEIQGRVVDRNGSPVRDAVVFVDQLPPGAAPPADHPHAIIDQINKEFVPHVLPVMVGTEVSFPNHDQIHHHVYSLSRTKTFEIPLYKGEPAAPVRFDQPGAVKLGCNIHDWMSGVILVVPTPYFATTDEAGNFSLRDVPPGTYGVVAWQEGSKTAVDETRQTLTAGDAAAPVTFTLDVIPPRKRPAARRGYE
jgi:plastocyanin